MRNNLLKVYLTCFILFTWCTSKLTSNRSTKNTKNTKSYLTDNFNVDSYISVQDKEQWYQYLADFTKVYSQENTSVWRTVNPIVCYLAVRLFPLEYIDEVQKVFARMRFSSNCGNRRDIVFISPIEEDNPYDSRTHPKSINVLLFYFMLSSVLNHSLKSSTHHFTFLTENRNIPVEVTLLSPKRYTERHFYFLCQMSKILQRFKMELIGQNLLKVWVKAPGISTWKKEMQ